MGELKQLLERPLDKGEQESTGLTAEELSFFSTSFSTPNVEQEQQNMIVPKMRKTYLIPNKLVQQFDEFCTEQDIKKTDAITLAMEEFLKKYSW